MKTSDYTTYYDSEDFTDRISELSTNELFSVVQGIINHLKLSVQKETASGYDAYVKINVQEEN